MGIIVILLIFFQILYVMFKEMRERERMRAHARARACVCVCVFVHINTLILLSYKSKRKDIRSFLYL